MGSFISDLRQRHRRSCARQPGARFGFLFGSESYQLFTPGYTKALIDIGYRYANKRIDEIEDFLYAPVSAA